MEYQRTEKDLTEVIRAAKLDEKSITRISQVGVTFLSYIFEYLCCFYVKYYFL